MDDEPERWRNGVRLIHATHPDTRILVIGVFTEADDPGQFDKYRSGAEMANIHAATAVFNDALRKLVASSGKNVAFFDDTAILALTPIGDEEVARFVADPLSARAPGS